MFLSLHTLCFCLFCLCLWLITLTFLIVFLSKAPQKYPSNLINFDVEKHLIFNRPEPSALLFSSMHTELFCCVVFSTSNSYQALSGERENRVRILTRSQMFYKSIIRFHWDSIMCTVHRHIHTEYIIFTCAIECSLHIGLFAVVVIKCSRSQMIFPLKQFCVLEPNTTTHERALRKQSDRMWTLKCCSRAFPSYAFAYVWVLNGTHERKVSCSSMKNVWMILHRALLIYWIFDLIKNTKQRSSSLDVKRKTFYFQIESDLFLCLDYRLSIFVYTTSQNLLWW